MAHTDHGDPRDDKNLIQDLEVGEENSSVSQEREINLDDLEAEYGHFKAAEGNRYNDGDNLVATQSPYDKLAVEVGGPLAAFTSENSPLLNIPSFNESVVTVGEYYHKNIGSNVSLTSFLGYVKSLFPIINWLPHYNIPWLYADVVAGVTVGCVLVPQSMSYAQLASLSSEYGLYSSFVGAFIYSFFATSKDVCIGPVAVMSLQVGKVIHEVKKNLPEDTKITGPIIATALALLCGTITTGIGLLRLGFLVELISLNAVAGFMTGSALSIISGQVPALMGYGKHVDTRESTYKVIISDLKHLKDTNINAVFGLLPLAILFAWKWGCAVGPRVVNKYLPAGSKKAQTWKAAFFYAQALRNAVVIILFTAISYAVTRNDGKKPRLALLGVVPSGLKHVGTPKLPDNVLSRLTPELPASVIVLLLEHIAISKSFARINNYVVVPDQELIAIGVTNLIATLFNAYPATGSFSRSALKAKCNVKTPLSGLFTGACVLLALYCLTDAFYYIPKATLSAVVIHAVADLVSSPKTALIFWRANPLDCFAFLATVIITVFDTIEHGIYFSVAWSAAVLIVKICFSNGNFLGYVKVAEVLNPNVVPCQYTYEETESLTISDGQVKDKAFSSANELSAVSNGSHSADKPPTIHYYLKWVPLDNRYFRELNPDVPVHPPPPGIIVYRPTDSWVYINTSRHFDMIYSKVKELTRPGALVNHLSKRDRPWNDPGEWRPPSFIARLLKKTYDDDNSQKRDTRPILRVLAMDWSQVVQIDSTGVQSLVDLRNTINRYANRQVEFHFSGIVSPWIKRALINAGFGTISKDYADNSHPLEHASYHIINSSPNNEDNRESSSSESHLYTALGTNTPFFHLDMPDFTKWDP